MFWLIPLTLLALSTGAIVRNARRRSREQRSLTTDPVSSEWLAEARGRDDYHW